MLMMLKFKLYEVLLVSLAFHTGYLIQFSRFYWPLYFLFTDDRTVILRHKVTCQVCTIYS